MKLSAILGPLLDAKADHELIRKMILAHEEEHADALQRRRESDAARQAAKRSRDAMSRESRDVTVTVSSREGDTRGEDNLQTKNLSGQKNNKNSPHDELAAVLDDEHADAVVEHRQKLRKPLTSRGAKMLATEFRKTSDPNAAADRMIRDGWQGFEAAWLDRPQRQATAPPPSHMSEVNSILDAIQGKSNAPPHAGSTIVTSYERTDRSGPPVVVQLDAIAARR